MVSKRTAFFFDRDDTLIKDFGYMHDPKQIEFLPGAIEALKLVQSVGIKTFIFTNQGGIGRGFFSFAELDLFHKRLLEMFQENSITIHDIAYCPHHPLAISKELKTPCGCRKPEPGMLLSLSKKWNLDLPNCIVVGDRESDVKSGKAAGCKSYLIGKVGILELIEKIISENQF